LRGTTSAADLRERDQFRPAQLRVPGACPDRAMVQKLILISLSTVYATLANRRRLGTSRFFTASSSIGCPTSSVAQANLTIRINFNILRSFSSSDILTIYLHAFLQSLHPFEKNCVQGLPKNFRQNNPNTNKKFRWSFSAISISFPLT
jgi:hypothetical protein